MILYQMNMYLYLENIYSELFKQISIKIWYLFSVHFYKGLL